MQKWLCLGLLLFVGTPWAQATSYYVDSAAGNDSNSGRATDQAWKTVAKVNGGSFTAGDQILFKKGGVWRESLTPPSGASGAPITIGAFGSGNLPVISGADLAGAPKYNWGRTGSGTNEYVLQGNAVKSSPKFVWIDGKRASKGSTGSLGNLQWAWNGSSIVVRDDSGDPDTTGRLVEFSQRDSPLNLSNRQYVVVDGLEIRQNQNTGNRAVMVISSAPYITIRNCKIHDGEEFVVFVTGNSHNLLIENCEIYNCTLGSDYGAVMNMRDLTSGTIRGNNFHDSSDQTTSDQIGVENASNLLFEFNKFHDHSYNGIYLNPNGSNCIIRYNEFYNITTEAVRIRDGSKNNQVYYNLMHDNGQAVVVVTYPGMSQCDNNKVYNNTVYHVGGANAFQFKGVMSGCLAYNNVIWVEGGGRVLAVDADAKSGVKLDYNTYVGNASAYITYGSSNYHMDSASSVASYRSASGQDAHTITSNPLFVNGGSRNLHLQAGSPCRDKGTAVGLTRDFDGTTIPTTSGVDMGAYEYSSAAPTPTPTPTPVVSPTPTPTPVVTPTPTPTPQPTATPTPTPTPTATPTPTPTPAPPATPVPQVGKAPMQLDYADTVSAPVGAWVSLWGVSLGDRAHGTLKLGATAVTTIQTWTDQTIVFQVPAGATSGVLTVTSGQQTATLDFIVRPGNLYYVDINNPNADPNGPGTAAQPWKYIGGAADRLQPGDTVYISSGTYNVTLQPARGGSEAAPIMYKALPGQTPVLDGTGLTGTPDGIRIDGGVVPGIGHLTFSGLKLVNFAQAVYMIQGANHCNFYNLDASNGQDGLLFYGASDAYVAHCDFHNNRGQGVVFNNYSSNIQIRDCQSWSNGASAGGGFEADQTVSTISLDRCKAYDNASEGFDLRVDGLMLNNCQAYRNTIGFHLWRNARVQNSVAVDNVLEGILCDLQPGTTATQQVLNCTVAGNHAKAGIEVVQGLNVNLCNIISVGGAGPAVLFQGTYTTPVIDHCIVQTAAGAAQPTIVWGKATGGALNFTAAMITGGQFASQTGQSGPLLAGVDPNQLFRDYGLRDLSLNPYSQARDIGSSVDMPTTDLSRSMRGVGNGLYDIGAYEFGSLALAADESWTQYQ